MKKQIPLLAVSLLFAVSVITLNQKAARRDAEQTNRIAELQHELDAARAERDAALARLKRPTETRQPTAPRSVAETPEPEISAEETTRADEREKSRRVMSNMARMMEENPTMNKIVEASQRGVVGAMYADLIDYLDLNAEETDYFMDLLMRRQMNNVELGMKLMSGELSEDEKNELLERMRTVNAEVEEELKKFLNSEPDAAELEFYEKTMGERMMLSQVDAKLAGTDAALSEDAYRQVLEIMHEEKNNFTFTDDLGDQESLDIRPERFSQANIDRYVAEVLELGENIDRRLETFLTPEQMKAYHESGEAMMTMYIGQLQQARQMFGGE